ncbi:MAG: tRNA dihydrouridine synthase DusB [Clostridiaceae bacterium]|jgi:nifR3 family TIM-barrel protein|nr:tRNA dihydrouridine synthase DusB [Clostridiaceae bacterium]
MRIGNLNLRGNIFLAPLAGYTDPGFRALAEDFGAALTYTEMVSAKGLMYGGAGSAELLACVGNGKPKAVQIFGGEPEFIYKAVASAPLAEFSLIDINMGCPVPKIVKNGEGSALMRDVSRAAEVVSAAVDAAEGRPVTVKTRLGFDDGDFTADKFCARMQEAGAAAVTVHGRYRAQFYAGTANYELIRAAREAVTIPFIANGDIETAEDAARVLEKTGADGVMLARGALGRPWIFASFGGADFGDNVIENTRTRDMAYDSLQISGFNGEKTSVKEVILRHIELLRPFVSERILANNMKKHLCYYAKTTGKTKAVRAATAFINDISGLIEAVDEFWGVDNPL